MESRSFNQDALQTLSPIGRALFNKFGRGEAREYPFKCIHQAFEYQARSHPDYVAVEDIHEKVTYSELDRQSNCLAAHLREMGIQPGSRVGLLVERSISMIVGILAVLKAGGAYVPMDGNVVSSSTLTHALRDSNASLVLVQDKFTDRVFMTPTLSLEEFTCPHTSMADCSKPEELASPKNSAYIIYTSGTTSVPKGVDVTHQNVTNLVCLTPGNLAMSSGLRVSQLMNISFDMAAWEILGSLCNGSTLCLRGRTSKEWRAVMKTIDIMIATPSMLGPHNPTDYPNIKVVAVGGEPCPKRLADTWAQSVDFYNCCGPTEVTIVHTMHKHTPGEDLGIGVPTPNNTVYILDDYMNPVKIGDVGTLWAGGAGITRGYINAPSKTDEVYKLDPFLNDGSMMFNTGDLGRWFPNGNLEHLGRVDDQVKVKGFRVELDGVAAAMETTPGVKLASAILLDGELWGFFMPPEVSTDEVKASTSRVQPYYAVPNKYIPLGKFPVTTNGKVDKVALKKFALESSLYVPHSPSLQLLSPNLTVPNSIPVYPLRPTVHERRETFDDNGSQFDLPESEIPCTSSVQSPPLPLPPDRVRSSEAQTDEFFATSSPSQNISINSVQIQAPSRSVSPSPPVKPKRLLSLREDDERSVASSPSIYSRPSLPVRPKVRSVVEPRRPTDSTESIQQLVGEVSRRESPRYYHSPPPRVPPKSDKRIVSPIDADLPASGGAEKAESSGEYVEISLDLPPYKNQIDCSSLEDQTSIWAGYKQDILPRKDQVHPMRNIWHQTVSLCQRLFGLAFFINVLTLIGVASHGANALKLSEIVVANVFVTIILRQDYVIDGFYLIFTAVPPRWPLWIRKIAAGVHHIGGLHSGTGVSSFFWQIYFTVQATKEVAMRQNPMGASLAFTYVLLFLLFIVLVLAHPRIHKKIHTSFEMSHRLFGYAAVTLFWIQTIILANDYRPPDKSLGMALAQYSPFWLLLIITVSLILPWLRLKKVEVVYCERVSSQALRMYFDYTTPPAGSLIRVSEEPWAEWRNFATLPEPGKPGFSIIVNRGGEWAKQQIANPSTRVWVRGIPIYGVMRIVSMFRRIVLVATSSGIGSCIPMVLENKVPIRLLWISSNVRQTFGNDLVDSVLQANPQAVIYDTLRYGKPDMVRLTYRLVKEFDAEAVIVISNKRVMEKLVYEMITRGVPAFGAT